MIVFDPCGKGKELLILSIRMHRIELILRGA